MAQHLGIAAAAAFAGTTTTSVYVAVARGRLAVAARKGQRLYFLPEELKRFQQEEVIRRAKRQKEIRDAAERTRQFMAKYRAARS